MLLFYLLLFVLPLDDVEYAACGDLYFRDNGQTKERQSHERIDIAAYAERVGEVLDGFEIGVGFLQRLIGHKPRDRQRQTARNLAVGDEYTALSGDNGVYDGGDVLVGRAHCDNIMRVVSDGSGDRAFFQSVAFDIPETYMPAVVVALDYRDFQYIVLNARRVCVTEVVGYDLVRDKPDKRFFVVTGWQCMDE